MIEGYVILIKIAENGSKGNANKVKDYMKLFIDRFPEHDLVKPFTHILSGNINPDGLCVLDSSTKNELNKATVSNSVCNCSMVGSLHQKMYAGGYCPRCGLSVQTDC